MSFGITELAVQAAIQDGLALLRAKPHHLEFILNRYCEIPYVAKRVGNQFIKNAMDLITKQDLVIRPYYTEDMDVYPCLVMAASYNEDQKYLGDYGSTETLGGLGFTTNTMVAPTVYAKFDALSVTGDEITVFSAAKLQDSLFVGLWVMNGAISARIKGFRIGTSTSTIYLDRKLAPGTTLKGWTAQTLQQPVSAVINGSHNAVTVSMALFTTGDMDLHRVYTQVIRYCLKRGRKVLDMYGIQNSNFSQQPPMLQDNENLIFRTSFSMDAVEMDTWIEMDSSPTDQITDSLTAVSENPDDDNVPM